jgi:two-component system chemotaxis response regulator CheB
MDALPAQMPSDGGEAFTRVVCPDCRGSLTVQVHNARAAAFTCLVGHSYSVEELLAGKEAALENRLWEAVHAFEELAILLTALERHRLIADGLDPAACRRRAALARDQAGGLRSIIQADRPLATATSAGQGAGPAVSP